MIPADVLVRAAARLAERLEQLDAQLDVDESAWAEYADTVRALAVALEHAAPGRHGQLLTTRQLAQQLGVAPRTLRRWKRNGTITPAVANRWRAVGAP